MPLKRAFFANLRAEVRDNSTVKAANSNNSQGKRCKIKTQQAIEGDQLLAGTAIQLIELPKTQLLALLLLSLLARAAVEAAVEAAADLLVGQVIGVAERLQELQVLKLQVIAALLLALKTATDALVDKDQNKVASSFNTKFIDNYNSINQANLRLYVKLLRTLIGRKSQVFKHSYCIALQQTLAEIAAVVPKRTFFVCCWCYYNALTSSVIEVTAAATTLLAKHLAANRCSYCIYLRRKQLAGKQLVAKLPSSQLIIINVIKKGVKVSYKVANKLSSFNIQGFQLAAVHQLVKNNYLLRKFKTKSIQRIL